MATYNKNINKKRIVFITGTRADFGKIKTLIKALFDSKIFDVHIFATGMHMLASYGHTVHEIEKHGFPNIYKYINHTENTSMESILANTISGLGNYFKEFKPDMVVVHGDRVEALAGALAGSLNNILVAHIEGGEVSGTIDEHIRHAISKMSHIHFVANQEAKTRLLQMGEDSSSIHVIGSPDIDVLNSKKLPSLEIVKKRYGIKFNKYAILIYHSVTSEIDLTKKYIKTLVNTLLNSDMNYIVIYPNNDPGTDMISNEYNTNLMGNSRFKIFQSIRFEYFLTLMKNANFIIGNSSAGVREAPYCGVPAINIGSRQNNRIKATKGVFNCNYKESEILGCINKFSSKKIRFKSVKMFGKGDSHKKFLKILKTRSVWNKTIQKQFKDLKLENI
ncbi:MAG: UDP-N-acetylglucosamine 2-epimerase (hydrolyzing) [Candidatus Yanofskybacteria bacterium CG10_big_fil_rev_8_21_14_0_10_36_16]|uniref:UDP-N-acetylglucosamine 2-epimerase (Hydrolyzing) n=1 Tax=Candidatus Yanofskybacteria bacterium CG10_big_fil_rev_8_21_14_0_10_36_16 TaxID=1975096 RepID=A0A2J0QB90_9BACT|nr:MAG: UDP-N-acetylglucosamine 2-epimerase (hydrolyzing) [Candidatus Yanofskybacteria bacterium CG10_big_fil_rev_8_21_14_0_10_36_16]